MAGTDLEWVFKLVDKASGPAASIQQKLQGVEQTMRLLDKASGAGALDQLKNKIERQGQYADILKRTAAAEKAEADRVADIKAKNAETDALIGKLGGELGLVTALVAAWTALGLAVAGVTLIGAKFAIEAADFKGDMLDAYASILGSEKAAKETFDKVEAIARTVPQSAKQVHELAGRLLAGGLSKKLLADTVKAMADLEAASKILNNPEAVGKIESVIQKASQTGKFMPDMKALKGTGVEMKDLFEALAKRMKVGVDQIEALMKAGKISAEVGIDALNEVLEKKFGGIAAKQMKDLDVLFVKFKDNLRGLFGDVDAGPFLDLVSRIVGLFDPATETGKRLKGIIEDLYNTLFKLFETSDGDALAGAFNMVLDALEGVVGLVKFVLPYFKALGGGFIEGLGEGFKVFSTVLGAVGKALGGLGKSDTLITFLTLAGKGFAYIVIIIGAFLGLLGAIFGTIAAVVGGIASLVGAVVGFIGTVIGYIVGLVADFFSIGSSISQGIADGINAAAGAVIDAIVALCSDAIAWAKRILHIGSPSKAFAQLGKYTSMGFGAGVANDNSGQDAVEDMVSPPQVPSIGGMAAASGGKSTGGGGGGRAPIHITINVQGGQTNAETADAVKGAVIEALEQLDLTGT